MPAIQKILTNQNLDPNIADNGFILLSFIWYSRLYQIYVTPLEFAIKRKYFDVVKSLLKFPTIDVTKKDDDFFSLY
mgnify:CR=1 FL=1